MVTALLTNILFWSGVAIGGIVFAALLEVTGGEWSGPLRLRAERFRWFLPLSFLAFAVTMWRSDTIYPWARQAVGSRWFRPSFVALRVDITCALVYACAFAFCRASRRSRLDGTPGSAVTSAVVFLLVYGLGFSLIAVDTIMSLEPRWTSTLFPAYVFTGNAYAGMACLAALAVWDSGTETEMPPARARDMANLLVAAALFWLYLFWSQFLVIWYGNLTAEVGFMMARLDRFRPIAWIVLALCSAIPAVIFVPRWGKRAAALRLVAPLILIGMWLERWMLVAPDVPSHSSVLAAILVTAAFAAAFFLSVRRRI
jgi:hypothetical protein